jgi:hypothetical protein
LALFVLVPTLLFTIGTGCFVWGWALVWYFVARKAYTMVFGDGTGQALIPTKGEGNSWANSMKDGKLGIIKEEVKEVGTEGV